MIEAVLAIPLLVLVFLTYLLFFERGPTYSILKRPLASSGLGLLSSWRTLLSLPSSTLDRAEVVASGLGFYDHHARMIASAKSSIHLESYILEPGQSCQRLMKALALQAQAGVEVRVLLDRIGSFKVRRRHLEDLRQAGGEVEFYHPLGVHSFRRFNNRSHRNLLIIDGSQALIGGAGIADFWGREVDAWYDTAISVFGSVACRLQAVFCEHWREVTGEILADEKLFPRLNDSSQQIPCLVVGSSPITGGSSPARLLYQLALASAQHSIDLCTPYFIPDRGIREALIAAAKAGVQTRVMTSGPYSDHSLARHAGRRRYGSLLKNGVDLYEYRDQMMHSKSLIIDGRCVIVGSTNIDNRSFNLNDEVNLAIEDSDLSAIYADQFEVDLAQSNRITMQDWLDRSWRERTLAYLGRWLERHD